MGILGLFQKSFLSLKKRGDKAFERQEWAVARNDYRQALERYDNDHPAAHHQVETRLAEATDKLVTRHREAADRLLDDGFADDALDHYRLAADLVRDVELKQELLAQMEGILAAEEERLGNADDLAFEEQETVEGAFCAENPDERFGLLVEQLPEDVREAYIEQGPGFRKAYLTLHEGGEENAAKALAMFDALLAGVRFEEDHKSEDDLEEDATGESEDLEEEEEAEAGDDEEEEEWEADEIGPLVQLERGRALLVLGRYEESVDALQTYLEEQPDDVMGLKMLAEGLDELERHDEALEALEDLRALAPEDPETYVMLGAHHMRTETYAEGIEAVLSGLEQITYPRRQVPIYRTLGRIYVAAGEDESAIPALTQAVEAEWEIDNETGELFFDRASAWVLTGLLAKGGKDLHRALDLVRALERGGHDEERWALLARKGDLLKQLGESDEARDALLRARSIAPENADGLERIDALLAQL